MLINAQSREELRIAIVTDSTLDTYQVEVAEEGLTRGNIYRGIIANIQPSLNAAFIDYGAERHGFLPIQDVVEEAYYKKPKGKPRIETVLEKNRPIVVQVSREPEAQKGAALTTNLSLAGRYLVLTPFDEGRGVSRKVDSDDDRKRLKSQAAKLQIPKGCGVIVRTNALDQTKTALERDLAALLRLWKRVGTEARQGKGTQLLYSDQDLILQALRDYLDSSIEEVLVDDDRAYAQAEKYMRAFMPRSKTRLTRYAERAPLFSKYNLEPQIDRIYQRSVDLPSGGSVVIDRTEALTAIDVNSGRSTRASSQEETAVSTNVEAAREVARQLRLRDIGGLIVVDFIDMRSQKNRRKVEKTLREAMKDDKARFRVGRISPNGLLEINRQRIHQALSLRTHRPCPTCAGTGRIASPEMVGLNLLRRIEARAATGTLQKVRVALHPELADAFQNGRRREITALEQEFDIRVEVVSASHLHRPDQEVDWFSRPKAASPAATPSQVPTPPALFRDQEASVRAAELAEPRRSQPSGSAQEKPKETPKRKKPSRKRGAKKSAARQGEPSKAAEEHRAKPQPEESRKEASPAEAEEAKRPKRRRRSRRKGKSAAETGSASSAKSSESPAGAKAGEGDGGKPETRSAPEAAGGTESAPARKRPRRRARRQGGGGAKEASGEAAAGNV
jgi:ribonuclease E